MKRKEKIEAAKALLCSEGTNVFDCLTTKELDKLKQHGFEPDEYLNNKIGMVHTKLPADKKTISELIAKLDRHAEENSFEQRTVIHMSRYHKDSA